MWLAWNVPLDPRLVLRALAEGSEVPQFDDGIESTQQRCPNDYTLRAAGGLRCSQYSTPPERYYSSMPPTGKYSSSPLTSDLSRRDATGRQDGILLGVPTLHAPVTTMSYAQKGTRCMPPHHANRRFYFKI